MEQVPWSPTGSCTVICALGSLSLVKYDDTYFTNYKKNGKLVYNMFSRFWQWFPSHSLVHRHIPGDIQVPPFRQEGLHTAISGKKRSKKEQGSVMKQKQASIPVTNLTACTLINSPG